MPEGLVLLEGLLVFGVPEVTWAKIAQAREEIIVLLEDVQSRSELS